MWSIRNFLSAKSDTSKILADILAQVNNREELLGMKPPIIPTPDGIRVDAARILKYTDSEGYKKFAEEAWAQVINGLDKILDPKATNEVRNHYCGEVNATLNLLRLSYKALEMVKQYDKEHEATSRPLSRG